MILLTNTNAEKDKSLNIKHTNSDSYNHLLNMLLSIYKCLILTLITTYRVKINSTKYQVTESDFLIYLKAHRRQHNLNHMYVSANKH